MTNLSIIVLSFNTSNLTTECLKSLSRKYQKELAKKQIEIIVFDNASTDASASVISNLKSQISNLKFIESKENLGFTKGNNKAVKQANGKYILFLNSDTQVLDENFLDMISYLDRHKEVGILGAKLTQENGKSELSAGHFFTLFNTFLMLLGLERFGFLRFSPSAIQKVDWVSGGAMMIRKNLFDTLKGFDENFFMYLEDMELCYRVEKQGFCTYFYPFAVIRHKSHGSSNRSFAIIQIYKGILHFFKKHKSHFSYKIVKIILRTKSILLVSIGKITNNIYLTSTYEKTFTIS